MAFLLQYTKNIQQLYSYYGWLFSNKIVLTRNRRAERALQSITPPSLSLPDALRQRERTDTGSWRQKSRLGIKCNVIYVCLSFLLAQRHTFAQLSMQGNTHQHNCYLQTGRNIHHVQWQVVHWWLHGRNMLFVGTVPSPVEGNKSAHLMQFNLSINKTTEFLKIWTDLVDNLK